jgi:chaperonin GroES
MSIAGKKDVLAAGGRKMVIAGGIGEGDIFRNVAPEGSRDESIPVVEPTKVIRQKFTPLDKVILVREMKTEQKSTLVLDTVEQERPSEGFIVERGPNVSLSVGTHVVYGKYSGTEFKLNGETLLLMNLSDIMGTVTDEVETTEDEAFPGLENVGYIGKA